MSIQDMIKKSVLESGVFDSFNAPKMAISLIVALLLGAVIYMVYSKFYVGGNLFQKLCGYFGRNDASYLYGYSGDQYEHCDLTWYGRSVVYRSFPYSGERSDGSAISFWAITTGITTGAGNVCAGSDRGSCDDRNDLLFYHKQQKGRIYIAVIHYQEMRQMMKLSATLENEIFHKVKDDAWREDRDGG